MPPKMSEMRAAILLMDLEGRLGPEKKKLLPNSAVL